jgi:hypothetical protein
MTYSRYSFCQNIGKKWWFDKQLLCTVSCFLFVLFALFYIAYLQKCIVICKSWHVNSYPEILNHGTGLRSQGTRFPTSRPEGWASGDEWYAIAFVFSSLQALPISGPYFKLTQKLAYTLLNWYSYLESIILDQDGSWCARLSIVNRIDGLETPPYCEIQAKSCKIQVKILTFSGKICVIK